jgi:hypothetical protein
MVILDLEIGVYLMIPDIESVTSFIEIISEIKSIVLSGKTVKIVDLGKTERIIKDSGISRCFELLV